MDPVQQIYNANQTPLSQTFQASLGFLRCEKICRPLAGFESTNLGSSGEYDNHWTTGFDIKIQQNPVLVSLQWQYMKDFFIPLQNQKIV